MKTWLPHPTAITQHHSLSFPLSLSHSLTDRSKNPNNHSSSFLTKIHLHISHKLLHTYLTTMHSTFLLILLSPLLALATPINPGNLIARAPIYGCAANECWTMSGCSTDCRPPPPPPPPKPVVNHNCAPNECWLTIGGCAIIRPGAQCAS